MYPYRQKAYHRLELPSGPHQTSRLGDFTRPAPHISTFIYGPALLLLLAACGGGGGGGGTPSLGAQSNNPPAGGGSGSSPKSADEINLAGTLFDGPIEGALIYVDVNNNGKIDHGTDKYVGVTGDNGQFAGKILKMHSDKPIIALLDGATDKGNDLSDPSDDITGLEGIWRAPAGSKVISPLTELLVKTQQSKEDIAELVGLPKNVDFTQRNPFDANKPANIDFKDEIDQKIIKAGEIINNLLKTQLSGIKTPELNNMIRETVADTNIEPPVFTSGESATASVSVDENITAHNDATSQNIPEVIYTAKATLQIGVISYSLAGTDADAFVINDNSGEIWFRASPDYEIKDTYNFIINALIKHHTTNLASQQTVAVNVLNLDEPGSVANWEAIPKVGAALVAPRLIDGDATGALSYQWQKKINGGWDDIGTNADRYLPSGDDEGEILQVIISYTDSHGDKRVTSQDTAPVGQTDIIVTLISPTNNITPLTEGASVSASDVVYDAASTVDGDINVLIKPKFALKGDGADDDRELFEINGNTGEVSFLNDVKIPDYETAPRSYIFTIIASIGTRKDELTVTLNVLDVDEEMLTPPITDGDGTKTYLLPGNAVVEALAPIIKNFTLFDKFIDPVQFSNGQPLRTKIKVEDRGLGDNIFLKNPEGDVYAIIEGYGQSIRTYVLNIIQGGVGTNRLNPLLSESNNPHYFTGGEGDDKITGGSNGDSLYGQGGDDILSGGGGIDYLSGGAGKDRLTGGEGYDIFILGSPVMGDDKADVITDFTRGDKLLFPVSVTEIWFEHKGGNIYIRDAVIGGKTYVVLANTSVAPISLDVVLTNKKPVTVTAITSPPSIATYSSDVDGTKTYLLPGSAVDKVDAPIIENFTLFDKFQFSMARHFGRIIKIEDLGEGKDVLLTDGNGRVYAIIKGYGQSIETYELEIHQGYDGNDYLLTRSERVGGIPDPNPHYFTGGEGDDRIIGGGSYDSLYGQGGDDILSGGGGDDYLSGGAGKDNLTGGTGEDIFILGSPVMGDDKADVITDFTRGDKLLFLRSVTEIWFEQKGGNIYVRDAAVDGKTYMVLANTSIALIPLDVFETGKDPVTVTAITSPLSSAVPENNKPVHNIIFGTDGDGTKTYHLPDNVFAEAIAPIIKNFTPFDKFISPVQLSNGQPFRTQIKVEDRGAGDNIFLKNPGDDVYAIIKGYGQSIRTYVLNIIQGGDGNNVLDAVLNKNHEPYYFTGGEGDDIITGGSNGDSLYGQGGKDTLSGGGGVDYLSGGAGKDRLTGGEGYDIFILGSAVMGDDKADVITDFMKGDKLLFPVSVTQIWLEKIASTIYIRDAASGGKTYVALENVIASLIPSDVIVTGGDPVTVTAMTLPPPIVTYSSDADGTKTYRLPGSAVAEADAPIIENFTPFDKFIDPYRFTNGQPLRTKIKIEDRGPGEDIFLKNPEDDVYAIIKGYGQSLRTYELHIYQGDYRDDVLLPLSQRLGQGIDPNQYYFTGGEGDDRITGGGNGDSLYGQAGDDILSGGGGIDQLSGGIGQDNLTGGAGNDIFILGSPVMGDENADVITDFTPGDKLLFPVSVSQIWVESLGGNIYIRDAISNGQTYVVLENVSTSLIPSDVIVTGAEPVTVFDITLPTFASPATIASPAHNNSVQDIVFGSDGDGTKTYLLPGSAVAEADAPIIKNFTPFDKFIEPYRFSNGQPYRTQIKVDDRGAGEDIFLKNPEGDVYAIIEGYGQSIRTYDLHIYQGDYRDDVLQPLSQLLTPGADPNPDPNPHYFTGGAGDDRITGGGNGDSLYGQGGDDILSGGGGIDYLSGGAGKDRLTGGAGYDIFILGGAVSGDENADVITDFTRGDKLLFPVSVTQIWFEQIGDTIYIRDAASGGKTYAVLEKISATLIPLDVVITGGDPVTVLDITLPLPSVSPANIKPAQNINFRADGDGSKTYLLPGSAVAEADAPIIENFTPFDKFIEPYRFSNGQPLRTQIKIEDRGDGDDVLLKNPEDDVYAIIKGYGQSLRTYELHIYQGDYRDDVLLPLSQRLGQGIDPNQYYFTGGGGDDRITGGGNDDFLYGQGGNDILVGGNGDDQLSGGAGQDRLTGGAGADIFIMGNAVSGDENADVITDFQKGDTLLFQASVAKIWVEQKGGNISIRDAVSGGKTYAVLNNSAHDLTSLDVDRSDDLEIMVMDII